MQLMNGFVVLDANEARALKDLAGDRFPYTTVRAEKLYADLNAWRKEAKEGDPGDDPLRMFAKEMIVLFSDDLISDMVMLGFKAEQPTACSGLC